MEIAEVLKPGQEVNIAIQGGSGKHKCTVKKVKDNLVAVPLAGVNDKGEIAVGKKISISWGANKASYKSQGTIIQNKAFPIVVGRFGDVAKKKEEEKEEEQDEEGLDLQFDKKYVKESEGTLESDEGERDLARVEDAFPISFFVVDQETKDQKKEDYLSRRTRDRQTESQIFTELGENEVLEKLANADPGVIEVINDLYKKYSLLASKVLKKEVKGGGEKSSGTCIDLSGGGLQFLTKRQIKPNIILKFLITPPSSPPLTISALGEVKRIEKKKDPTDRKMKYAYGTHFYAIHEDDREEIIQYTFKRQQEMLKARRRKAGYD